MWTRPHKTSSPCSFSCIHTDGIWFRPAKPKLCFLSLFSLSEISDLSISLDTQYSWAETTPVVQWPHGSVTYINAYFYVTDMGGRTWQNVHLILRGWMKNSRQQIFVLIPNMTLLLLFYGGGQFVATVSLNCRIQGMGGKLERTGVRAWDRRKAVPLIWEGCWCCGCMLGVVLIVRYCGNTDMICAFIKWGVDCGMCRDVLHLFWLVQGSETQMHTIWLRLWYWYFTTHCRR